MQIGKSLREAAGTVPYFAFQGRTGYDWLQMFGCTTRHGAQVASPLSQSPPLSSTSLRDRAMQALSRAEVSREGEASVGCLLS